MKAEKLINLDRYPLDQLDSPHGKSLISHIRQSLRNDGSCALARFVTDSALKTMASQAESINDKAYSGPTSVSPYFFNYDLFIIFFISSVLFFIGIYLRTKDKIYAISYFLILIGILYYPLPGDYTRELIVGPNDK